jgi:hypothetical protein
MMQESYVPSSRIWQSVYFIKFIFIRLSGNNVIVLVSPTHNDENLIFLVHNVI